MKRVTIEKKCMFCELLKGFDELEKDEQFIYDDGLFEFIGIKINEDYAAFLNGNNKFILSKRHINCLSIGSGHVSEYSDYESIVKYAEKNPYLF